MGEGECGVYGVCDVDSLIVAIDRTARDNLKHWSNNNSNNNK